MLNYQKVENKFLLNNAISCAVCGDGLDYKVLYPERIILEKINFSAKKAPRKSISE